jgi:hypothetical protein
MRDHIGIFLADRNNQVVALFSQLAQVLVLARTALPRRDPKAHPKGALSLLQARISIIVKGAIAQVTCSERQTYTKNPLWLFRSDWPHGKRNAKYKSDAYQGGKSTQFAARRLRAVTALNHRVTQTLSVLSKGRFPLSYHCGIGTVNSSETNIPAQTAGESLLSIQKTVVFFSPRKEFAESLLIYRLKEQEILISTLYYSKK